MVRPGDKIVAHLKSRACTCQDHIINVEVLIVLSTGLLVEKANGSRLWIDNGEILEVNEWKAESTRGRATL